MFEFESSSRFGPDTDEAIRIGHQQDLWKPTLHLAVLCDEDEITGWQRQSLEHLAASGWKLTLLPLPASVKPEGTNFFARSLIRRIRDRSPALRQTSLPPWLRQASQDMDDAAPDVVLDFRSTVAPLQVEPSPRLGVWTVVIDHIGGDDAVLAVIDRFGAGHKVFKVALVSTRDGVSDPRVLREGAVGSEETLEMTVNGLYDALSGWLHSVARQIEQDGEPAAEPAADAHGTHLRREDKSALGLVSALSRSQFRRIKGVMKRWFFFETWNIGICDVPIEAFLDPNFTPDPVWFKPPRKYSYYADPFPVPGRDGELLCEFLDATSDYKGRIVRLRWHGSDRELEVSEAIDRPFHLSYPCQIVEDGQLYCLPEAYQSGRLLLFKTDDDGRTWHEAMTLLELPAVDPIIFRHADRWWLFCTLIEQQNVNLHIWHAASLEGPWTPHAGNPVKTDVATARPGGTPFVSDGRLYRPAQDCSTTYGGAISLMEITHLDQTHFAERLVRHITLPTGPYRDGTHTLSAFGSRTLIDAKQYHFAATLFLKKVVRKIVRTR
jgi:hypothetical protein